MKIAVLGTGMVGQVISAKLISLGHNVLMGTRNPAETLAKTEPNRATGRTFSQWHNENSEVELLAYSDLPFDVDLIINATNGTGSIPALSLVGAERLAGKTLLDLANPLDFSKGMPPSLFITNTDSLAEQIQREFPEVHVVKSLNTMNCTIMVEPSLIPGDHNVFVCGDREESKEVVISMLQEFGWTDSMIIDLGDLKGARASEMVLPIWINLYGKFGGPEFNFHIQRK